MPRIKFHTRLGLCFKDLPLLLRRKYKTGFCHNPDVIRAKGFYFKSISLGNNPWKHEFSRLPLPVRHFHHLQKGTNYSLIYNNQ